MILYPNAKINIGLFITEKRADGFHNIESCFFPINWQDILEIVPTTGKTIFSSSGIDIPGDIQSNICLQAYNLIKQDFDIPDVSIHLHKMIPIGAGLGGGSADGAFMLKGLNNLFNLNLSIESLENYARQLGSDCAFFIQNKPIYAYEKGDEFEEIENSIASGYLYIVNPGIHVSTQKAYAQVKPSPAPFDLKKEILKDVADWKETISNDFEKSVFPQFPEIEQLKNQLYELGATYAAMSGSGSTVFGIFKEKPEDIFKNYPSKIIAI